MNILILKGNITRDPELKFAAGNGNAVAKFGIAIAREFKSKDGQKESDFLNCVAFGKTAEAIANYLTKGSPILINGHIQTGSYNNKEGKKVYTTDVIVDKFEFIQIKKDGQSSGQNNNSFEDMEEVMDDTIPF